jgi:hypothetical protein
LRGDDAGDDAGQLTAQLRQPDRHPDVVIHGDKDYRVPIAEALRLWHQLLSESRVLAAEDGTGACISRRRITGCSRRSTAKIWYHVVTAFLSCHVLGEDIELPETLG